MAIVYISPLFATQKKFMKLNKNYAEIHYTLLRNGWSGALFWIILWATTFLDYYLIHFKFFNMDQARELHTYFEIFTIGDADCLVMKMAMGKLPKQITIVKILTAFLFSMKYL